MEQDNKSPLAPKYQRWLIAVLALFGLWVVVVFFASSKQPAHLGITDGKLAELPDTPNAVSSQTTDPQKRVAPIPWEGKTDAAMERLVRVVTDYPRTRIVERTEDYLHAEFRSLIFRFVDDVEFFVNQQDHQIEVRSASRLGHSDLGVNRRRVEQLRERFLALGGGE